MLTRRSSSLNAYNVASLNASSLLSLPKDCIEKILKSYNLCARDIIHLRATCWKARATIDSVIYNNNSNEPLSKEYANVNNICNISNSIFKLTRISCEVNESRYIHLLSNLSIDSKKHLQFMYIHKKQENTTRASFISTNIPNIIGLAEVSNFKHIHTVYIHSCIITSVADLQHAHKVSLRESLIIDSESIHKLANVYELDLSHTDVCDVSSLGRVHTLNISHTHVRDVSALKNVCHLDISYCKYIDNIDTLCNNMTLVRTQ